MNKLLSPVRFFLWGLWSAGCMTIAILTRLITFSGEKAAWLAKHLWVGGALAIPGVKLKYFSNAKVDKRKPYVFVGNHSSFLDIPCAVKAIDNQIYWIAKQELKKMPFLGWYVMATDMIFIDRSNKMKAIQSLFDAAELIKGGKSIVAFPEGTRSKDGNMKPFKKGPFMLAIDAGVPIVPVAIAGTFAIFPPTKMEFNPGKALVKICDPVDTDGYTKSTIQDLMDKVHQIIEVEKEQLDVILKSRKK